MSPYRTEALPVVQPPSQWMRALAVFTPERLGAQHRWYRYAIGGRWSRVRGTELRGDTPVAVFPWRHVRACPAPHNSGMFGDDYVPDDVCSDTRNPNGAQTCFCEEWPTWT